MNVIQHKTRNRRAQNSCDRKACQKQRDGLGQIFLAEPVGKVKKNSRNKAGFGHAQQEPRYAHLHNIVHESGKRSHEPPSNQDSRDPRSCSDPIHQKIAWDLKDEITEKENSCDQPKLLAGDREFLVHGESCESYVDSVQESNHVEHKDKWNYSPPDLAYGPALESR